MKEDSNQAKEDELALEQFMKHYISKEQTNTYLENLDQDPKEYLQTYLVSGTFREKKMACCNILHFWVFCFGASDRLGIFVVLPHPCVLTPSAKLYPLGRIL